MIWLAVPILVMALLAALPRSPKWLPGGLIPLYFMISLTGQMFALPATIGTIVLAFVAEETAAWVFAGAAALFGWVHARNRLAGRLLLDSVGLTETPIPLLAGIAPFMVGDSKVRRIKDLAYGEEGKRNLLDIVLSRDADLGAGSSGKRPILIHVHGGAWVLGAKGQQAKPLMNHLAGRGWMCVDINYRLGPANRFPAMIIDVLKAIAWVKAHAHEYGGDPNRIALTGGSAGGQLTALAALAHDDPAFKPGFEDADCSVARAVPVYGRFDLLDRLFHMRNMHKLAVDDFMARRVFPGGPETCNELWLATCPSDRVRQDAPPMLITHGTGDTMLPFRDARDFADALRRTSTSPVTLVELPEIEHAYDMAASALTWAHVRAVTAFLAPLETANQADERGEASLREERALAGR